jgi:hypothetical protein
MRALPYWMTLDVTSQKPARHVAHRGVELAKPLLDYLRSSFFVTTAVATSRYRPVVTIQQQ